MMQALDVRGVKIWKNLLSVKEQEALVALLRSGVVQTPFFSPQTPYGKPMSVQMTSMGRMGWYSDRTGYRYVTAHPNGQAWPDIPAPILALWSKLVGGYRLPDCCLVNFYGEGARMGMHQDKDEADFSWPVLSVSLGDDALFRIGNEKRGGKTDSIWLASGDVVVLGGAARLLYHGVDKIRFGSSHLLPKGGRINLTCRVAS